MSLLTEIHPTVLFFSERSRFHCGVTGADIRPVQGCTVSGFRAVASCAEILKLVRLIWGGSVSLFKKLHFSLIGFASWRCLPAGTSCL